MISGLYPWHCWTVWKSEVPLQSVEWMKLVLCLRGWGHLGYLHTVGSRRGSSSILYWFYQPSLVWVLPLIWGYVLRYLSSIDRCMGCFRGTVGDLALCLIYFSKPRFKDLHLCCAWTAHKDNISTSAELSWITLWRDVIVLLCPQSTIIY